MAYLKKPNRLFTSKPQNTIGGGTIEGDNLGSRTGFKGPELIQRGENAGKYRVKYRDPQFGKDAKGHNKEGYTDPMTKKQAQKFYDDRQKRMGELKSSGPIDIKTKQTEQINNFVNDFIDKNIKSYGVKDYDQFKKDMLKEFKRSGIKDAPGRSALAGDIPNIGTYESRAPFTKFDLDPAIRQKVRKDLGITSDLQNYFKKIFYSGVFENNPDLVNKMSRYLDYQNIDKKFYGGNINKVDRAALLKEYADVVNPEFEADFIYMMDEMEQPKLRGTIFKKYFGDKYDKFIEKRNASMKQYLDSIKTIENKLGPKELKKALGTTSISKFMDKQTKLLNKIFDTSVFTGPDRGLIFAADHLEGIAEIAKYKNKDDIIRGLQNVAGTTVARNRELGWKTLSRPRRDLISKIQKGIDVEDNVKELNRITKLSYPDFKGDEFYRYDPKTKNVVPTENFTVKYSPEEGFKRYFTELATTEKGTEQIVKQSSQNPELLKFLKSIENKDFKNIGKVVKLYQKEKLDLKGKLSDLYCGKKEGGRIGFADGPTGFACSIDEIQTNMKRDLQTPEGKSRVSKLIRGAGSVLKNVIAPVDAVIESAFMLPSLLAGDPNAALNNTTLGLIPYFNTTGVEKAQKLLDKGYINQNQYNEIIQGFKADEAIAGIMKNINDTDQLFLGYQNIGILPDEQGKIKSTKASPERVAELTQNFGKKFIELSKEKENLVAENQQYAPALATAQGMSKTYNAFRQGLVKEATTPLSQLPYSENIGMRDIVTDIGKQLGTGDFLRKQKMQDPRFVVEGVGDPYFDYMNKYYSPYMEDVRSGFTGKDPRDRFANLPISAPSALAQTEKMDYIQGLTPFLENMYRKQGPQVLQSFAEQQGIDLSQFPLKGVPNMKQGGRIQFSNGGRLSFAEGPEDPSKRRTLKKMGIAGGITGGVMTGLINILDLFKGGAKKGVVATKAAESEAQKIFFDLVDAVKNKGIMNRLDNAMETKVGVHYEYKGVQVLEDGENIEVRFDTDKGAPAFIEYRKPGYEVDPDAGKSYKVPGEFTDEGQEVGRIRQDGDVDIDTEFEIVDPIESVKEIAKGIK